MKAELGLEEFIMRSSSSLTQARTAYELSTVLENRRQKLRSDLETAYDSLTPDEVVSRWTDSVIVLRNLNTTQVQLAQETYDTYDRLINELDARIRLFREALSVDESGGEAKTAVRALAGDLEPRYCVCGGVASGEMICCDNMECPIEWYHCVCLSPEETSAVSEHGTWYCPRCRAVTS